MPNNPVQVVLNTNNFIVRPETTTGGSAKDFFVDRNAAFAAHQKRILGELDQIGRRIAERPEEGIQYAHVVLQSEAWAKTKRPTTTVLRPDNIPMIGGGDLGELLVEFTTENLPAVRRAVAEAEIEVRLGRDKENREVPKPTRKRSEVGAISTIRLHEPSDRRAFSLDEAIAWLEEPRSGGFYIVETFAGARDVAGDEDNRRRRGRAKALLESLQTGLAALNLSIEEIELPERWRDQRFIFLRVNAPARATREDRSAIHQRLLEFLDHHSAVRRILLPPLIEIGHAAQGERQQAAAIAAPAAATSYPVVGIVDTGVSIGAGLEPWCAGRTPFVGAAGQDQSHGTFIAGLTVAASQLNPDPLFSELPCKFFDLAMYPTASVAFKAFYPNGFVDFLQQLDVELAAGKAAGARIFNMSLALERQVKDDSYGLFASMIDEIVDSHDILLVLPAGNLGNAQWRSEWPEGANEILQMLAEYRHSGSDRILEPAESVRSIVTGAVNPPSCAVAALRPAIYTRRGPSAALGSKPDVAHIGGSGAAPHELYSVDVDGVTIQGCGTSYAAPLVARSLAHLDHRIEGKMERETLIALLAHHASLPATLQHKNLERICRDFVGFGIPSTSGEMLETDDHQITLLFEGALGANEELAFNFAWPASLVNAKSQCRGRARATLVYRPPVDRHFDAEFVRANLDVYLRQEKVDLDTGEVTWKGQLVSEADKRYERELIEHGQKWWPVKKYDRQFTRVGSSSQWKLVVDGLARLGTEFPADGIPFSVLLTIEGTDQDRAVFQETRQGLLATGVTIADVRTAARVGART